MTTDGNSNSCHRRYFAAVAGSSLFALSGCLQLSGNDTPTETDGRPTATSTPALTDTATATDSPTPTSTDSPTDSPTDPPTDSPTETETETPTESETPTEPPTEQSDATLVMSHTFESRLEDEVNDIDGDAASAGVAFRNTAAGTVLDLLGGEGGYYDISDRRLQQYLTEGDSVSLSMWVNPDRLSGWEMLFNGDGLILDYRYGELRFRWYESGDSVWQASVSADSVLETGTWTHLAGVLDAGSRATLYADGQEVGRATVPFGVGFRPGVKSDHARVGYHPTGDDGASDSHYDGQLDTVQLYRGALDETSVRELASDR